MYPPLYALSVSLGVLLYWLVNLRLTGNHFEFNKFLLINIISTNCFVLLIRIADEFKDYQDDLINFPQRPLPSGRVERKDLKVLASVILGVLLSCNIFFKNSQVGLLIVLLYTGLMTKWFFIESRMRKSLPLALLSHHPIVYIHYFYQFLIFSSLYEVKPFWYFYCIPLGFMATSWEFARKTRLKQEENTYTTYSKLYGLKSSLFLIFICMTITSIGLILLYKTLNVNPIFPWLTFILFSLTTVAYLLKCRNQTLKKISFKQIAENNILSQSIILLIALIG